MTLGVFGMGVIVYKIVRVFIGIALILTICAETDDRLSQTEIVELVNSNIDILKEDIANNDFSRTEQIPGIKKVEEDNGIIDFYCGGYGFGSATAYCGFYYTTGDDISAIWCAGPIEAIVPDGNGFTYREYCGDNYYYTEKICENFYYYKASF